MPADRVEAPKVEAFEKALTEYALWAVRFSLCKCDTVPCYHGTAQRDSKAAVVEAYREALQDATVLAKLAADTPQFDNPLVAWGAKAIRDKYLHPVASSGHTNKGEGNG